MQNKKKYFDIHHRGKKRAEELYARAPREFDYGPLDKLQSFQGTHPEVMRRRIAAMDWQEKLQYAGKRNRYRIPYKHERLKYRLLTWLEQHICGGREIGGAKNFILLRR